MVVHPVSEDTPGEPLAYGLWAELVPAPAETLGQTSHLLPQPDPASIGVFVPDDAPAEVVEELGRQCAELGLLLPVQRRELAWQIKRLCYWDRASLVAFDLPEALALITVPALGPSRKERSRGGFSRILGTKPGKATSKRPLLPNGEVEDGYFPRIEIRGIDAHRALVSFSKPGASKKTSGVRATKAGQRPHWKGSFVSLRALAEALSGDGVRDLAEACSTFEIGPPNSGSGLVDAVERLRAECELYAVLLKLHRELAPDNPPDAASSSGGYARALLRQARLKPPLNRWPDFNRFVLDAWMEAYFAGEVETRVRAPDLPVRVLDLGGAYAVAASLSGAFELLSARELAVAEEDPREVAAYVADLARRVEAFAAGDGPPPSADDWRRASRTLALVRASGGELPHRRSQGPALRSRRAELRSEELLPFVVADLVVATLGSTELGFDIVSAHRLEPKGAQRLQPMTLPTGIHIEPNRVDPILALAVERIRLERLSAIPPAESDRLRRLMKAMANALSSGLPIQVNDQEPTRAPRPQIVFDSRIQAPRIESVTVRETPGSWYFPPLAAGVTATARLLLHVVIEAVNSLGGVVSYWDTDSVFVVAEPEGGDVPMSGAPAESASGEETIRALSYAEVHSIRELIEQVSPYPGELRASFDVMAADGYWERRRDPKLLKLEAQNIEASGQVPLLLASRAAKRYFAYRVREPGLHVEIRQGKPLLVEPTSDQRRDQASLAVPGDASSRHGLAFVPPRGHEGADSEAWVREGFAYIARLMNNLPADPPSWWNLPAVTLVPATRPEHIKLHPDARAFCKLAVWSVSGGGILVSAWHPGFDPLRARWIRLGGGEVGATMPENDSPIGKTFRDAFFSVWRSVDAFTLGPDGSRISRGNLRALLKPEPTVVFGIRRFGKEGRRLGTGRGVLEEPSYVEYGRVDPFALTQRALALLAATDVDSMVRIAEAADISQRWLREVRSGTQPGLSEDRIVAATADEARRELAAVGRPVPKDDLEALAAYIRTAGSGRVCQNCGTLLGARQRKWCSERCRKQASRGHVRQSE